MVDQNNRKMPMKFVSSVFSFGPPRSAKTFHLSRLFNSAWCWVMAGLVFLPATFRAWSADCVPPQSNLVAWWPGDGNANDIGGTNNGALQGGATFATGMVGQAFNFDGVNGYVEVANSSNLNPAASFSIEGWIFPRKDQTQAIMSKWADTPDQLNQRSYGFNTCPNEALQFAISDWAHQWDASFQVFNTTNNVFVLNTWSHVAAVYDQPAGARRIYVTT
jgi:Concanavalin A-like lectin/glucanases superfamily